MKKIYVNPKIVVVRVQPMRMFATSEVINQKGNYDTGSGITLGAREDFFDDYDDEYED